ncbi:glycosyltransferase [Algoriphagus vanfongensis]|uniref:glycosyltransferase n=1 Tax=Algoriphagus vanfongensis TaxID=426371 RepID=UPI00041FF9C7|nr:glycosyltransferase [Algoriphagus vanfongensis]
MINQIGVVIVTYKRENSLQLTLRAVLNQGINASKIWVINNNPLEKLKATTSNPDFMGVNFLHQSKNIASAGGFALGMSIVAKNGLDWAWLFNDDSRPVKGSIESIINHHARLEVSKTGMVKLANLNSNGEAILQYWNGSRKPKYVPISQDLIKTDLITFDGCLISSNLIKEVGTCDPSYFMGTYEFDYCLKAADHKYEIYTIPNGLIEDEKAGSTGGTPPWRQYYNTRNHLLLGIQRMDFQIIWAWMIREIKFSYAILRWENKKTFRLKLKALATWHAMIGKKGMILDPDSFQ